MVSSNQTMPPENRSKSDLTTGLRVTWIGLLVNVGLSGLKLLVGFAYKSQALIADGFHSLSDLFSDTIVILGLKWGRKAADEKHPYGHARIETITGLIIGIALIVVGLGIAYHAILAIYEHRDSDPSLATILAAILSIAAKEAMYRYTIKVSRRIKSIVLAGNAWHHRSDALSSVAVLIGVTAAYINPAWHLADSIAAAIVSIFIMKVGFSLAKSAIAEVVDTAPDPNIVTELTNHALSVTGAKQIHDIKARYLGPHIFVEMHVVVDPNLSVKRGHDIAKAVERYLLNHVKNVASVIIHIDPDESES